MIVMSDSEEHTKQTLKACPFCAFEPPKEMFGMGDHWILCPNCKASIGMRNTKEQAIKAWNTRKGENDEI